VAFLASDDLEGGGVGLPGLDRAAHFIAADFAADGLKPLPGQADYFQRLNYTTQMEPGPGSRLSVGASGIELSKDFAPMRFSAEGNFAGPAVFVGFGISAPESGYDDYRGLDVKGKVVIAMRYEPSDAQHHSRLATHEAMGWSPHATFSEKAKTAGEHGAAALLIVNVPDSEPDWLLSFSITAAEPATIPVIQVKQTVVDQMLAANGSPNLKTLCDKIDATFAPQSVALNNSPVSGAVEIKILHAAVENVVGYLPGKSADEYVVLGAHYDHLGLGQLGHMIGPAGSIYHGADDNASGTATVLELASRLPREATPARSIVFICFTAEEEGLVGSQYFVAHPPIPLDKIVAMVNLDMVGRIKDQTLYIGGQGTAKDFDAILAAADHDSPLQLKSIGRGGMGPSDHMSFATRRVPVLFFFSGMHVDYHRPTDIAQKINYAGMDEVADFTAKVIAGLTTMPRNPYEVEADKDSMHLFGSPDFGIGPAHERRVMLGVVPDYGSADSRAGVLISGTTPGSPAEAVGLRGGDLLVQFGDQKLGNLMDLSQALGSAKPGERVTVKAIRGSQMLSFDVTLVERGG
jgi:hypothetical protein